MQSKRDLITGLKTRTNAGRPNWDKVFKELQAQKKGKITNLDPRDRWNRTPLHWAILNNHFSVTLQLLDAGAKVVPYDEKKMGHLRNVHNSNTHLPMETPLELAVRIHGKESQFVDELLVRRSKEKLPRHQ